MNATQLFHESGKPAGAWYCETCRHIWKQQADAESCCRCRTCGEACPRDSKGEYTQQHSACFDRQYAERMAKKLAEAEETEAYDGWVMVDGWGPQNGYFSSAEEAEEYIADNIDDDDESYRNRPQWAFCCKPTPPPSLDAGDVIERLSDDLYEDAADDFQGVKELQAALDAFCERNKGVIAWNVDYSRKVRLNYEPSTG